MKKGKKQSDVMDKNLAAVCGLYCRACSVFIATTEDPERLQRLAAQFQLSEEEIKCYGCRSDKRCHYRSNCKIFACATERGIEFCSECEEYPCENLNSFQSEMPHRIELWDDLERIKTIGYAQWLREIQKHYACPRCQIINSAYDLKCRNCGEEPSCDYVGKHRQAIEQYLTNK